MGDVEVPAVGKVPQQWLYVGGAVVAGIVGWAYYQRRKAAATPTTDPVTGMSTGTLDQGAAGDYTNPAPVTSTVDLTGGAPTTNAAWSDLVTTKLSNLGDDAAFIASSLGKYLSNTPLTSEEADLIRRAWAYAGKPPQGPGLFSLSASGSTPGSAPAPDPAPAPAPAAAPPPPAPAPPAPAARYVTVVRYTTHNAPWNSTLSGIAAHEGTTVSALLGLNPGIHNANLIYPGQQIRVA